MDWNWFGIIQGGEGPDVWEIEQKLSAVDVIDAATQCMAMADELCGHVVALSIWEKTQ